MLSHKIEKQMLSRFLLSNLPVLFFTCYYSYSIFCNIVESIACDSIQASLGNAWICTSLLTLAYILLTV
jgi:hypothetical protein